MKFGESTTFTVTSVDKKGRGCATVGGRSACVPFAVPGETVEATLVSRKQGALVFRADRVVTPSPRRLDPRCPYVGRCGGCAWQQFDYAYQLELKRGLVNAAFEKASMAERIEAVVPCPEQFYYRNRMDYCVGPNGELGLKEPGRWNAYLDLETCFLLSPDAVKAMAAFRAWMRENAIAPWDARSQRGYARYLVIREGKNTGERMITVVTADGPLPAKEALVAALSPFSTTLFHGINPTVTDLSIAHRLELLAGKPALSERIAGKTYEIPPNSFFQTNSIMAEKLLSAARAYLAPRRSETLLDLYCGVGFFGIGLADTARRVVGIELDEAAIAVAARNAAAGGIANASFTAAKAESLVWREARPDTVIVDPPRAGLHPKVIATLIENAPDRIVYISCNYESFARDAGALAVAYRIAGLQAFDLFPHSPHVELAVLLEKKEKGSHA